MTLKIVFPGIFALLAIAACVPAQARSYHIHIPATSRHVQEINTEMGYIRGHAAVMPTDSSAYRNMDAKCAGRGLNSVTTQSATVGINRSSRRNFYTQCMIESGVWR
ncbi:hypothetical protein [Komagataeibacter swingsii]|uniref:UrcA family protein n=1 Tax=Komagataeibacter swingsii TaxID=215220 RepID=A0A2V4RNZ9_9PROT|nr:hypothetical protein [Komagataeibacter swingsii]PYD70729.1 hypothetical protein CFR76_01940 [Komagataeibacter swingsii]GBQ54459.1 hypothetical protein AA16373_0181 [Komagataeibacter swingsii DSM 16373]